MVVTLFAVPASLAAVEATGDPAVTGWLAATLVAAGAVVTSTRLLLAVTAAAVGGWATVAGVYVRLHDPCLAWAPAGGALAVAAVVAAALHAARRPSGARGAPPAAGEQLTDGVTGLANREGLRRTGAHVLGLARRSGREASVLVVELASARDAGPGRCGPDAAAVLRATGQVLAGTFRAADVVARIDDACFAVLLVGPTPGHVAGMVERLRRRLDEHGIHVRTGSAFLRTAPVTDAATHPVERLLAAAEAAARPPATPPTTARLVPAPRTPEPTQVLDLEAPSDLRAG